MIPFSLPLITRIKHQGSYTTLQRKEKHEAEEPSSAFAASLTRAQMCQEHILSSGPGPGPAGMQSSRSMFYLHGDDGDDGNDGDDGDDDSGDDDGGDDDILVLIVVPK